MRENKNHEKKQTLLTKITRFEIGLSQPKPNTATYIKILVNVLNNIHT